MGVWFKYIILIVLIIPISPILFIQGLIIKNRIKKLPIPEITFGNCQKQSLNKKDIAIIGESTMAGVGILDHNKGFAGNLAKVLSSNLDINIHWKIYAKRGYAVKKLTSEILPQIKEKHFDLIVVGIGGNDTFELRNPIKWRKHILELISLLQERYNETPIIFLNIPPIKDFPAFSWLLKIALGELSKLLGEELHNLVSKIPNVWFNDEKIELKNWLMNSEQVIDKDDLFCDGVHPSEITYELWAQDFSDYLLSKKTVREHLRN